MSNARRFLILQISVAVGGSIRSLFRNHFSVNSKNVSGTTFKNCISSIPPEFNNYKLLATQSSADEQKVTDEALYQIISAVENDPISSKETCTIYIEKLCRSGNLINAARLLQGLHDKQIFLKPKIYNIFMTAAGEGKDFEVLFEVFKDLLLSRVPIGPNFYSVLAKAFSNGTDFVPLRKFVIELSELIFPRSAAVINRIIYGFAESGQMDKSLMIFDYMKNLKCKPDIVTYNTVLDILGAAGRVDDMLQEFASMKEAGIIPDIISYNTLINSLRKMGRLDLCLVFLCDMSLKNIEPDLRTYTALIESFGRSGRVEEALRLFNEMKRKGIRPSVYIYRALISNLKKIGKFDLAISLLDEMNSCISDLIGPKDFKRKKTNR